MSLDSQASRVLRTTIKAELALCTYLLHSTPLRGLVLFAFEDLYAGMAIKDVNGFLIARYVVFGLFTICNAIICCIAVWNFSFAPYTQSAQVDIYLIVLGASALLSVFTLIFVELLCVNAMTTRVWFECAWVALFWLMELAGGAALIAIQSDIACSLQDAKFASTFCTSERVLLAFTWICTAMLLVYLLALVVISAHQNAQDPKIWVSDIRALRMAAVRPYYPNTPNSALTTQFTKRPSTGIYKPYPTRSPPTQSFPSYASFNSDYVIEPFRPVFVAPEQMDIPYSTDLPEAIPIPPIPIRPSYLKPFPPLPKRSENVRSWSLQSDVPPGTLSSTEYPRLGRSSGPVPSQSSSLPSPSPLGDWPRQDVMQLPTKSKRKVPLPSAPELPKTHPMTMAPSNSTPVPGNTVTQPRQRRPSGPRQREPSGKNSHRPAPLNLTGISNYETGRRGDA